MVKILIDNSIYISQAKKHASIANYCIYFAIISNTAWTLKMNTIGLLKQ